MTPVSQYSFHVPDDQRDDLEHIKATALTTARLRRSKHLYRTHVQLAAYDALGPHHSTGFFRAIAMHPNNDTIKPFAPGTNLDAHAFPFVTDPTNITIAQIAGAVADVIEDECARHWATELRY